VIDASVHKRFVWFMNGRSDLTPELPMGPQDQEIENQLADRGASLVFISRTWDPSLPLGGDHPALVKVLDFYASQLEDWDTVQNGADQLAKLAQALAPKAPGHDRFWRALAGRFVGKDTGRGLAQALTAAGKESLAAAFPKGGGPEFAGKRELLRLVRPSSRSRGRSRKRSRKRSSSRKRSRSRSRKRPR